MSKKYTSHSQASVMHCELIVDALCRQQFRKVVQWLIDEEIRFSFERLGTGDSFKPETYRLTIEDICWAHNVVRIAKKLAKFDYDIDGPEERNGENKPIAQGMSAGTEKTPKAAEGKARQPGPKDAPDHAISGEQQ